MKSYSIQIEETAAYGVVVSVDDWEVADELDDFLVENCDVLVDFRFLNSRTDLFFGQAVSIGKVGALIQQFEMRSRE